MVKIGDVCPLFFNPIKDKFGIEVDYIQKFYTGDNIHLQIFANVGESVSATLIDLINDTSTSISLSTYNQNSEVVMHYAVLTGLPDSDYKVNVNGILSEPFCVSSSSELLERTTLIKYSHKDNNSVFNNIFWIGDTQVIFDWRVEAGFKPNGYTPKLENEQYRNQWQEIKNLYSVPYDSYVLTIGDACGVPYWYGRHLNRILCLSKFIVKDTGFVRSENSVPEMSQVIEDSQLFNITCGIEPQYNDISGKEIPEEEETYSITVGINPSNIGQCTVTATGDYIGILPSSDGSTYIITAVSGGTVTVSILAETGYIVSQLNVDKVSQGAVDSYTFENIDSDHTMYVWMEEEIIQTDTDFLIRSDKPSVYYSGLGECIAAIKEDYPDKLTQDIMISCVKKATEIRGSEYNSVFGIWTSRLVDWNKDSLYTLTINGNNQYTINCKWLGGLLFENVDNVFIKGISMLNYCNFSGQSTPDEISAIMVRSNDDTDKVKNVAIHNCKFNGYYVNNSGDQVHTWYCLRFKNAANVIIDSCNFDKAAAVAIYMNGIETTEITRSYLQGDYYIDAAGVGHSTVLSIAGNNAYLKLADNTIDGTGMIEYTCSIGGVSEFDLVRNTIKNCAGQPFSISGDMQRFNIKSNLFHSNITGGQYAYTRRIFGCSGIKELNVDNNTVYFNGEFTTSQEFLSGNFEKLVNYNNIFINKLGKAYVIYLNSNGVKEYISGNNIYASAFWNDDSTQRFSRLSPVEAEVNEGDYLDFSFETRKLAEYQNRGYETDSVALSNTDSILDIDDGGSDYKLLESLKNTYLSNKEYAPEFDIDYLRASVDNVSPGAYNLFGEQWDETTDNSTGYEGTNMVDRNFFTSDAAYIAPTDDTIIIRVNSKNRQNFIKSLFSSDNGHSFLRFGKVINASLECKYDKETGMYIEDNNYTLTIQEENYG